MLMKTQNHSSKENAEIATLDVELQDFCRRLPMLTDKMIIDMVNGLEVASDCIRTSTSRTKTLDRAWDAFTGASNRGQNIINENFQNGLSTSVSWLQALEVNQAQTNRGIKLVADRLYETRRGVEKLIEAHLGLRNELEQLQSSLNYQCGEIEKKQDHIQEELKRIGLRQSAKNHMDRIFDKWDAGHLEQFAPFTQLLLVMEELFWSPFGEHHRKDPEFRDQVRDKCIIQLRKLLNYQNDSLISMEEWLNPITRESTVTRFTITYLLGSSNNDPAIAPISHAVVSTAKMSIVGSTSPLRFEERHPKLPVVIGKKRFIEKIIDETNIRLSS